MPQNYKISGFGVAMGGGGKGGAAEKDASIWGNEKKKDSSRKILCSSIGEGNMPLESLCRSAQNSRAKG